MGSRLLWSCGFILAVWFVSLLGLSISPQHTTSEITERWNWTTTRWPPYRPTHVGYGGRRDHCAHLTVALDKTRAHLTVAQETTCGGNHSPPPYLNTTGTGRLATTTGGSRSRSQTGVGASPPVPGGKMDGPDTGPRGETKAEGQDWRDNGTHCGRRDSEGPTGQSQQPQTWGDLARTTAKLAADLGMKTAVTMSNLWMNTASFWCANGIAMQCWEGGSLSPGLDSSEIAAAKLRLNDYCEKKLRKNGRDRRQQGTPEKNYQHSEKNRGSEEPEEEQQEGTKYLIRSFLWIPMLTCHTAAYIASRRSATARKNHRTTLEENSRREADEHRAYLERHQSPEAAWEAIRRMHHHAAHGRRAALYRHLLLQESAHRVHMQRRALREWQTPRADNSIATKETAHTTQPATATSPTGRTANGRKQRALKNTQRVDMAVAIGRPNKKGGGSFTHGAWTVTSVDTTQQQGNTCGAHCAVNAATPTWAGKKARLAELNRVRSIWRNLAKAGQITADQGEGEATSTVLMHAASPPHQVWRGEHITSFILCRESIIDSS